MDEKKGLGLHSFVLPGGTLGKATKADLLELAEKRRSDGTIASRTAAFFLAVAEMLPQDDSRVGDVLSEADLNRLYPRRS